MGIVSPELAAASSSRSTREKEGTELTVQDRHCLFENSDPPVLQDGWMVGLSCGLMLHRDSVNGIDTIAEITPEGPASKCGDLVHVGDVVRSIKLLPAHGGAKTSSPIQDKTTMTASARKPPFGLILSHAAPQVILDVVAGEAAAECAEIEPGVSPLANLCLCNEIFFCV